MHFQWEHAKFFFFLRERSNALVKDGMMHVQAGAGIVADSVPASEMMECVNKAKALFRAREEAVRFAAIKTNQ